MDSDEAHKVKKRKGQQHYRLIALYWLCTRAAKIDPVVDFVAGTLAGTELMLGCECWLIHNKNIL